MLKTFLVAALFGACIGWLFNREVCYGDLGCFDTQTIRSLSRPIVLLPDEPTKIGTRFFLYTRENPAISDEQELSRKVDTTLSTSSFRASRPTKIIIHGFTHSAHEPWVQKMKDELLKNADMNVIAVDWRNGAGFPYTQATANIRVVAAELTKLIEFLMAENPSMKSEDIHMIGHSLGAHCAGEVGTKIKRIGRISGLDPAEPYFEGAVEAVRLEPRDAEFVDIIHTDGSAFLNSLGMGYRSSIGHVDFYPNGGAEQPGCEKTVLSRLTSSAASGLTSGTEGLKNTFACSHNKAYDYFTESINSDCPFLAYPCQSYDKFTAAQCLDCSNGKCGFMGYHAPESSARGDFYLLTNQKGQSPQCNFHYKVSVAAGVSTDNAYGIINVKIIDDTNTTYGPFPMTAEGETIKPKTEFTRMVTTSTPIGDIVEVEVTYSKVGCTLCLLYSDFFRLQKVDISGGEDQITSRFCGKNISVATGQLRKFQAGKLSSC